MSKTRYLLIGVVVVVSLFIIFLAYRSGLESEEVELGSGVTYIQTVEVEERDGEYWAVVEGHYPDACSTYGGTKQEVDDDTIHLTITSTRPENVACGQMLTDMTEEILLETDGLSPGEYALIVNENNAITSFVIS